MAGAHIFKGLFEGKDLVLRLGLELGLSSGQGQGVSLDGSGKGLANTLYAQVLTKIELALMMRSVQNCGPFLNSPPLKPAGGATVAQLPLR